MNDENKSEKVSKTDTENRYAHIERDAYNRLMASMLAERYANSTSLSITKMFASPIEKANRKKSAESEKTELIKELQKANIDPVLFDALLSNETNRRLKVRFGVAFLVLTFLFTATSYAIVVLNGVYHWDISEIAITGLIIETPIQFVGLLYIIARNLFPNREASTQTV